MGEGDGCTCVGRRCADLSAVLEHERRLGKRDKELRNYLMVLKTVRAQWRSVLQVIPFRDRSVRTRLKERLNEFHSEFDQKVNEQTSPPKDEFIDLRCVWAVEIYTPSHIDQLINGLTNLGLGRRRRSSTRQRRN